MVFNTPYIRDSHGSINPVTAPNADTVNLKDYSQIAGIMQQVFIMDILLPTT